MKDLTKYNIEDRIKLAIERGVTCNPKTGEIFGVTGKLITNKVKGYLSLAIMYNKVQYRLSGHQFIYYWVNKKVVDCIDHINGNRDDNRIDNLRSVTNQQNLFNTNAKGYTFNKNKNKFKSQIRVNNKSIYLGYFDTEVEASKAYLDAKKMYHKI
jgi:hypothetical protein